MTVNVQRELYGAKSFYVEGAPLLGQIAPLTVSLGGDFEQQSGRLGTSDFATIIGAGGPAKRCP